MAKTNKKAIIALCNSINKKEGEGSIYSIGSKNANLKINRWSTGIEDLDAIIGGGIPEGRIVEIFGAESSGKTTLLYHLCGLHELCLDIPIEGTFDAERAKVFGNKPKQMLIYRAKYGEDALNKTIKFAKAGMPLIGIDSVPSMTPKEDAEKVLKSAEKDSIEEQRIGGTARLLNKYLPTVEEIIEVTGTTVIFINQVRDKMNALLFGEKTDTPGGRKLKHACSLRIQVARRAWIEIPNKDPRNSAKTEKIGLIMKCKVVKSKVSNPMGECEIPLIFDRGFVSFDEVPQIRKEIMKQRAQQFGKRVPKEFADEEESEED
jgi:recombination protein RecA